MEEITNPKRYSREKKLATHLRTQRRNWDGREKINKLKDKWELKKNFSSKRENMFLAKSEESKQENDRHRSRTWVEFLSYFTRANVKLKLNIQSVTILGQVCQ